MTRYIIPIILILLSVTVYVLEIDPLYAQIQAQMSKEAEIVDYIDKANKANDRLADLDQEYKNFPANAIHAVNVLLPDKIDDIKFLIEMDDFVKKHGLLMKNPKVAKEASENNGSPYDRYSFSFTVTTTYPQFRTLLRSIESNLALSDVATLSFSATHEEGEGEARKIDPITELYSYNVVINSYALAQQ